MDLLVRRGKGGGALIDWGAGTRVCAIGAGGIAVKRAEGDAITPAGNFPIRRILYRADRLAAPKVSVPLDAIAPDDGWCDAPRDPNYNRAVSHPYPASAEKLWRADSLYDLLAIIGFNDDPVVPGRGSAIFLHIASPNYLPTAGCVALSPPDLVAALEQLRGGERIVIG